jgi:elongation factor Tu
MFLRTADFAVNVTLPDDVKMATPGDNLKLTLKLEFPMAIRKGIVFS